MTSFLNSILTSHRIPFYIKLYANIEIEYGVVLDCTPKSLWTLALSKSSHARKIGTFVSWCRCKSLTPAQQLTTGANKWQIRGKKSLKIPPRKKGYIKNPVFFRFKEKVSKKCTFLSFQFMLQGTEKKNI